MGELINHWRNLKSLKQNTLLSLYAHVSRPFHKPCQVTFWLNIVTNTEVLGSLYKQWIACTTALFDSRFSGSDLLSFSWFLWLPNNKRTLPYPLLYYNTIIRYALLYTFTHTNSTLIRDHMFHLSILY